MYSEAFIETSLKCSQLVFVNEKKKNCDCNRYVIPLVIARLHEVSAELNLCVTNYKLFTLAQNGHPELR